MAGFHLSKRILLKSRHRRPPTSSDHAIQKMMMPFPLGDLEQKMGATLRSRNRIWFVGRIKILRAGETPLSPLPAPDPEYGWQAFIYRSAWSEQVGDFVRRHVRTMRFDK